MLWVTLAQTFLDRGCVEACLVAQSVGYTGLAGHLRFQGAGVKTLTVVWVTPAKRYIQIGPGARHTATGATFCSTQKLEEATATRLPVFTGLPDFSDKTAYGLFHLLGLFGWFDPLQFDHLFFDIS